MQISLSHIESAVKIIRKHNDIEAYAEEGRFYVTGSLTVLSEFEMNLAIELAKVNFQTPLDLELVRNWFVDIVDYRVESEAGEGERTWTYDVEVLGDIKAHEIRDV
jgi:hypothetical protein